MLYTPTFVALALSALLARAAPIVKRRHGPANIFDHGTKTLLLEDPDMFAPAHRMTFYGGPSPSKQPLGSPNAPPLTAVCWGGSSSSSTCSAYMPFANGTDTGFAEYASRGQGAWGPTGTPIWDRWAKVAPNTPIVAVSTLDVGGSDTWLFFVSKGNKLRFFKNADGGPADWVLGHESMELKGEIQALSATTWTNTDGKSAFSVWWNDAAGKVFSWRYDEKGRWNYDGQANGIDVSGAFQVTSSVGGNTRTFDLYSRGGRHWTTAAGNDAWKQVPNSLNMGTMKAVSGATLPWGGVGAQANLYYVSPSGALTQPNSQTTPTTAPGFTDEGDIVGSRTVAWQQANGGRYINVFAYKRQGTSLSITAMLFTDGYDVWGSETTVIPYTAVAGLPL